MRSIATAAFALVYDHNRAGTAFIVVSSKLMLMVMKTKVLSPYCSSETAAALSQTPDGVTGTTAGASLDPETSSISWLSGASAEE